MWWRKKIHFHEFFPGAGEQKKCPGQGEDKNLQKKLFSTQKKIEAFSNFRIKTSKFYQQKIFGTNHVFNSHPQKILISLMSIQTHKNPKSSQLVAEQHADSAFLTEEKLFRIVVAALPCVMCADSESNWTKKGICTDSHPGDAFAFN